MRLKGRAGFSIAEVLIVITAISVLAVISLPIFTTLVQDANIRAEDYNVACIKTGIELQRYKDYTDSL